MRRFVRFFAVAGALVGLSTSSRGKAQEAERWDSRWERAWDPGFFRASPPCSLDLRAGRRESSGQLDWYGFLVLQFPLVGCGGAEDPERIERSDGELGARDDANDSVETGGAARESLRLPESATSRVEATTFEARRLVGSVGPEGASAVDDESSRGAGRVEEETTREGGAARPELVRLDRPARPSGVGPRLAFVRELVRRALAARGFDGDGARLDELAGRARSAGLVPELRLRGAMGLDRSTSLEGTGVLPSDTTTKGSSDAVGEVRLTFRLNRLVFDEAEPGLARMHLQLREARRKAVDEVLESYLGFLAAERKRVAEELDDEARLEAEIDAEAARVRLDVLTDGWFAPALERERRALRASDDPSAASGSELPRKNAEP